MSSKKSGPGQQNEDLQALFEATSAELARQTQRLEAETVARRAAEDSLRHAQKMEAIGQLTGGIAHDFNNLLTVVGGSLDLIRRDASDPQRTARLADSAMTAIERCEKLIKQLLMFSRRQVMQPETVNPNQLIADFHELVGRSASENIQIETALSPVLYPARIDPGQFQAAILNLVVNAREAIQGRGKIVIETRNVELDTDYARANVGTIPGSYVMIVVRDTGHGIPSDVLQRVFEPFFTTKEIGKGSGLGLSQVYGFAKESGGHVKIESQVGKGTEVTLFIPRSMETSAVTGVPDSLLPLRRTSAAEIVLVVEDDEPVLDMAVESLKELGYGVLVAHDATEALDILRGDRPIDILFSDVVMPGGMNGVQLAVEAARLRPQLKILLTSGYTASALAEQHGLDDRLPLLSKPYRPQELAARFRVIMNAA